MRLIATILLLALLALLAACDAVSTPTGTPLPTQALNPAQPTATVTPFEPTATVTLPPAAADIARTATAQAPTPDPTEQTRARQRELALDALTAERGSSATPLTVLAVTGVRAGREIEGCGRAASGMALASIQSGEDVYEVLIEGEEARVCGSVNLYDDRPQLLLDTDPIAADLTALAVLRAARSAGVAPEEVEIDSVRPVEWPDPTLGCVGAGTPIPSPAPDARGVAGYRIVLRAGEQSFIYHTDFDQILACGND